MVSCRRKFELCTFHYILGMLTVLLLMSCDNAPPENMDESSVPVELSASAPERVSLGETYDIQPDITMDESGVLWTAWVGYMTENKDRIYVTSQEDSGWTEPEIVTPTGGNYVRPIIVNVGKEMVVLWTATDEETAIWESRTSEGGWSAPKQITPPGHHFNPEACVDDQGRLWMVWQGHGLIDYDIFLAFYDGGQWSEPISVSQHPGNEWDPSITCDSNGRLWIAWSRFQDAGYDLYLVSYEGEQFSEERRLTDHGAYDLHPWLTVDEQDRLWVAWDRIAIPEHGSSGEAVLQDGKLVNRSIGWGQPKWKKGKWYNPVSQADVGVLCLQSDSLFVPRATLPFIPPGYQIKHCAYPKIEADAAGRVWLAFRAWMFKLTNPHMYWWDVAVLCYSGDTWSKPEIIPRSDGYLEEPSVTVGKDSVWVAAQMEHRRTARPDHPHPEQGPLAFEFDHHWDTMPQGSSGEVYVTRYEVNLATDKPRLNPAPPLSQEPSSLSERWVSRDSTRYEIDYQGDKYQLLFGDTHKHSNISRCSGGTEPAKLEREESDHDSSHHGPFLRYRLE